MKWLALLAVFVLALAPAALADETNEETTETSTESTVKDRMQNTRDQMKDARAVRADIKPMRADLRKDLMDKRAKLKTLRTDLTACKGKMTDDCKQKRMDGKMTAKDTLLAAAQKTLDMLKSALARVEASELSDKEAIAANINEQITAIENAAKEVEALTEESTRDAYVAAAKTLKEALNGARSALHKGTTGLVHKRLGNAIMNAEKLAERLANKIEEMAKEGMDTTKLDLLAFNRYIDAAKKANDEAQRHFAAGAMKDATEALRAAHNALKDAHMELKKLLSALKNTMPTPEPVATQSENSAQIENTA